MRAEPVGPLRSSIQLPQHLASSDFIDFFGPGESTRNTPSNGTDLREAIRDLIRAPSEPRLLCVPEPGTMTQTHPSVGSDQRDDGTPADRGTTITFDRTGACPQAFDTSGGLVEVDGRALHQLLQSHSLNPPVVPDTVPTETWPAGSAAPPPR